MKHDQNRYNRTTINASARKGYLFHLKGLIAKIRSPTRRRNLKTKRKIQGVKRKRVHLSSLARRNSLKVSTVNPLTNSCSFSVTPNSSSSSLDTTSPRFPFPLPLFSPAADPPPRRRSQEKAEEPISPSPRIPILPPSSILRLYNEVGGPHLRLYREE